MTKTRLNIITEGFKEYLQSNGTFTIDKLTAVLFDRDTAHTVVNALMVSSNLVVYTERA